MKRNYLLLFVLLFFFASGRMIAQKTVITYATGDYQVSILSEGGQNANGSLLKGGTPEIIDHYLPDGVFRLEIQAFLVRTPEKNILIDAGVGKNLSDNLKSLHIADEQIHVILLTHMHGDHIGGLLREGKKVFPQAELYLSQAEYDYWMDSERGADARKVLEIYKDRLHLFVPGELGGEIPDLIANVHIKPVAAYGHTPGHTAFLVESLDAKLLIWGDIAHAMPVQMPHPEISMSFDVDPGQSAVTRKKILEYVRKNNIRIAGSHIVFPAIGDILPGENEGGYEFKPLCICEGS
ncbi:MAG: MBL fold metallo-hydrolase [Tannerella sp.]|jgi:glyoxylase-like metal-dependent hydrolase (beta-lactamase superfamily II)|nr:MBL fold metallo-hydrolase [Tannerella sp.]